MVDGLLIAALITLMAENKLSNSRLEQLLSLAQKIKAAAAETGYRVGKTVQLLGRV